MNKQALTAVLGAAAIVFTAGSAIAASDMILAQAATTAPGATAVVPAGTPVTGVVPQRVYSNTAHTETVAPGPKMVDKRTRRVFHNVHHEPHKHVVVAKHHPKGHVVPHVASSQDASVDRLNAQSLAASQAGQNFTPAGATTLGETGTATVTTAPVKGAVGTVGSVGAGKNGAGM